MRDFAIDYASIAHLRQFSRLKLLLEQTPIADIHGHMQTSRRVRAIVDPSHHPDLPVVAEGMENEIVRNLFAGMGSSYDQDCHPAASVRETSSRVPITSPSADPMCRGMTLMNLAEPVAE